VQAVLHGIDDGLRVFGGYMDLKAEISIDGCAVTAKLTPLQEGAT